MVNENQSIQNVTRNLSIGQDIMLPCTSNGVGKNRWVNWKFHPTVPPRRPCSREDTDSLYRANRIRSDGDCNYNGKYEVNVSASDGRFDLRLFNLTTYEAGTYECVDEGGLGPVIVRYEVVVRQSSGIIPYK